MSPSTAELGPLDRLPVDLIGEEYRVRHRFGDRPGHDEYFERFASQATTLTDVLGQVDSELATAPHRALQKSKPGPKGLHVRCPHCRNAIEIVEEESDLSESRMPLLR